MACTGEQATLREPLIIYGALYAPKALAEAWEINVRDGVVGIELSLLGEKPKFGNHGNRRKADRVACETMDMTGCSIGGSRAWRHQRSFRLGAKGR